MTININKHEHTHRLEDSTSSSTAATQSIMPFTIMTNNACLYKSLAPQLLPTVLNCSVCALARIRGGLFVPHGERMNLSLQLLWDDS